MVKYVLSMTRVASPSHGTSPGSSMSDVYVILCVMSAVLLRTAQGGLAHDRQYVNLICTVKELKPSVWSKTLRSRSSMTSVASPSHETSSDTSVYNTSTSKERRLVSVMVSIDGARNTYTARVTSPLLSMHKKAAFGGST